MAQKATVLVVEKDNALRQQLKDLLLAEGIYRVLGEAADGMTAVDLAVRLRPNIILMDHNIEGMDGFQATQEIRKSLSSGTASILIMTDTQDIKILKRVFDVGAQNLIPKPFSDEDVISEMRTAYDNLQELWKQQPDLLSKDLDGSFVTVFSTKGGVGKTTLAVNLATLMATLLSPQGRKVALVDCNFQFGDAAIMLDIPQNTIVRKNIYTLIQEMADPGDLDYELLEDMMCRHKSGLYFLPAPSDPQFADEITMRHLQTIFTVMKKNFDYIIMDTTSYIRDNELIIFDFSTKILIVVTLEFTAIKNVKLCKDILKVLNIEEDKCKLILNRAYQEMGIHHEDVENQLGPIDCFIPSDGQLVIPSLNMGKPFVLDHPASVPIVKSMYELCMLSVDDVDRDLAEPPKQQITEQDKSFGRFFKKILNK